MHVGVTFSVINSSVPAFPTKFWTIFLEEEEVELLSKPESPFRPWKAGPLGSLADKLLLAYPRSAQLRDIRLDPQITMV